MSDQNAARLLVILLLAGQVVLIKLLWMMGKMAIFGKW